MIDEKNKNAEKKEELNNKNSTVGEAEVGVEKEIKEEETKIAAKPQEKKSIVKDGADIFDDEEFNFKDDKNKELEAKDESSQKKKTDKSDKKGKKGKKKKKKKEIKRISNGRAFIQASYNNTIVTLTDNDGNVLALTSAGQLGFKGPKKSTPYAATVVVRDVVNKAKEYGLQYVAVNVKGVGSGRESAIRALNANGLNVSSIRDVTPVPHNGCRKKKPRRV